MNQNGGDTPQEAGTDPLAGWAWVTGEAFTYTNGEGTFGLEPNNSGANGEDAVLGVATGNGARLGTWWDTGSSLGADVRMAPVLGSADSSGNEELSRSAQNYVVEYDTRAVVPDDEIPIVVPEPASLALAAMGLLGVLGIDRRRRHG